MLESIVKVNFVLLITADMTNKGFVMMTIAEFNNSGNSWKNIITVSVKGYIVYAKTINGGRFISEVLDDEESDIRFQEYGSVVSYFGGGIVQKYAVAADDSDIIFIYDKVFL